MKKITSAAIAAMLLALATACGGASEYKKAMKALMDYEQAVKEAATCDDIQAAGDAFEAVAKDINEDAMSEDEVEKMKEKAYSVFDVVVERSFALCAPELDFGMDEMDDLLNEAGLPVDESVIPTDSDEFSSEDGD